MGKFVKGAWVEGCTEDMIGKKIIHNGRMVTPYGYDGSYCDEHGVGGSKNPKTNYVILRKINPDHSIVIEWNPIAFPGDVTTLESYWNTGDWYEVNDNV